MTRPRSKRRLRLGLAVALAGAGVTVGAVARPLLDGNGRWVELSFRLPAIGNVDQVKRWEYGRLESLQRTGPQDVTLTIRSAWGQTQTVICPREPFNDLARTSNWMPSSRQQPSSSEFTERMVAFSADSSGRVIAMASLEPIPRDARRIYRAFRR